jgi:pyruvate dehydrogenase E2 component (dihydrolipoamide acetyltransferase)
MTDKATVTITSPKAGTITETRGGVGEVVPVHSVLVVFDLGGGGAAAADAPKSAAPKKDDGPAATAVGDIKEDLPGMSLAMAAPPKKNGSTPGAVQGYFREKPLATPATRKLARDMGVDLRTVPPTGKGERVTSDDVRGFVSAPAPAHAAASPAARSVGPQTTSKPVAVQSSGEDERIPLRGVRKRIFEGMARSKHTAAHFTFVEECDVTALKELRGRLKPEAERLGTKLTFLPFIAKACVAAIRKHPTLNASFDETTQEIVVKKGIHLGIASATEAGLIVPVVRDADRRSLLDIARDIQRLGEDTKTGKVKPEDLGGSTFTITSLGTQGGLFATPILNFPEVAILGVHQIKEKPVVRNGQIVIGNVMLLSLSFDHRLIDGHVGAAFAYEIIGYLENPDRLFLEI